MAAQNDYAQALQYLSMLAQQDFAKFWAGRTSMSYAALSQVFCELSQVYGQQAAAAAVDYLVLSRSLDDDLAGLAFPEQADPVLFEQAQVSFSWAVNTSRQGGVFDADLAKRKLDGVLARVVTSQASGTIARNVLRDGTGFARVPEPGACAFCLMLASRGAVYSRETVGAVNKYHDGCRCLGIEVKRDGSDLPRINRDLEQLWDSSGSVSQTDFRLALATRQEFASFGHPLNTQVYRLPNENAKASIVRWQGMDRFYAKVQKVAEGDESVIEALQVLDDLDRAASTTRLNRDVLMWRGVRNWQAEFGVESFDDLVKSDPILMNRFKSLSADKGESERDFTTFGKAGALLRIHAKKGTPGIWMPTNGDSNLVSQQEFLVPPGARMKVLSVENVSHSEDAMPIIHVELSYE